MKPTLASLFPNASQSCQDANPQLSCRKPIKTSSTAASEAIRAILCYNETPNQRKISDSKPECHQASALDGSVQRKAKSVHRTTVRFIGYRVRPLDPDNFAGGCKDLLDGLRHSGLIPGDEPWRIKLETEQEKVKSYAEERTLIEIESP